MALDRGFVPTHPNGGYAEMSGASMGNSEGADHSELRGARGRFVRFRPERFKTARLEGLRLEARFPGQDQAWLPVVNFSRGGIALKIPGDWNLSGELPIEVRCHGERVLDGTARVAHHGRPGLTGFAFLRCTLDLRDLFARRDGRKLGDRLVAFGERQLAFRDARVPGAVKSLVADARVYLNSWKLHLDMLEGSLRIEQPESYATLSRVALDTVEDTFCDGFLRFPRELDALTQNLSESAEDACRHYIKQQLLELITEAPVNHRAYHKPLGYAGDYLVMNFFYTDRDVGHTLFGRLLHRASCRVTAARAVSARVAYLKAVVRRAHEAAPEERLRVLSFGCGASQEVQELVREEPEAPRTFTLADQDASALEHCHRELVSQVGVDSDGPRFQLANFSVLQLLKRDELVEEFGKQDLIYAAGLFDYLETEVSRRLIKRLLEMVKPGGRLVVGNFDHTCDTRAFMKLLLDWDIIYRSREDLEALAAETPARAVAVEAEETGVNLFLVIDR